MNSTLRYHSVLPSLMNFKETKYRIMNENNIIWQSTCIYVRHDTGEIVSKERVIEGLYKITDKKQETEIIYKNGKQYGYVKKTFTIERTNQGIQTRIEF